MLDFPLGWEKAGIAFKMEGEEVKREASRLMELKREVFEYSIKFSQKTLQQNLTSN